jgi:CheY-like chemotaxis protein
MMAKHPDSVKAAFTAKSGYNGEGPSEKKRVLLVDDDVYFLEINRIALESAGYQVAIAHDGKEGLQVATHGSFHVAVLDVIMATPNDGFELARALRNDARTERMPIVMLSSINAVHEGKGTLLRFSNRDRDEIWLPIDRFVDKPITPEALVRLVAELSV